MSKHDADCLRRKIDFPYLCTCALTDEQVQAARAQSDAERLEASRSAWERNSGPVYERPLGTWSGDE